MRSTTGPVAQRRSGRRAARGRTSTSPRAGTHRPADLPRDPGQALIVRLTRGDRGLAPTAGASTTIRDRLGRGRPGTRLTSARTRRARLVPSGSIRWSAVTNSARVNGRPASDQHARRSASATRPGRRITACASRYQRADRCSWRPSASARACQRLGASAFDARAERHEDRRAAPAATTRRGDERARSGRRCPSSRGTAAGRRAARHRGGDRQRAEQDRAPGGRERPRDRGTRVQAAGQLLAVTRDDEQASSRSPSPARAPVTRFTAKTLSEVTATGRPPRRARKVTTIVRPPDERRQQRCDHAAEDPAATAGRGAGTPAARRARGRC